MTHFEGTFTVRFKKVKEGFPDNWGGPIHRSFLTQISKEVRVQMRPAT